MKATTVVSVLSAVIAFQAAALTQYQVAQEMDGKTPDWTSDSTYAGGKAPPDLSVAQIVIDQIAVNVSTETFGDFSRIGAVQFLNGDASQCIVDTGNSDLEYGGAFNGDGWLVKKGQGKLSLTSSGHVWSSSTTDKDLNCYVDVQEGTLDNGADRAGDVKCVRMSQLKVGALGTFVLAKNVENQVDYAFSGAGTIKAPEGADKSSTMFMPRYQKGSQQEFSGRIGENIRLYSCANLYLSGIGSTMDGAPIVDGGASLPAGGFLTLKSFGMRDRPSSIGSAVEIELQEGGGRIQYAGTDPEICDKDIKITHSTAGAANSQSVIDGGAFGGLTILGAIKPSLYKLNQRLWLSGSNVNDCVIGGAISSYVKSGNTSRIHLTKDGTGAWHLMNNDSREGISGVTVRNGALKFDSLGDVGEACSFGEAQVDGCSRFCADVHEVYDPVKCVGYFFTLGAWDETDAMGLLKLSSSTGVVCATRPAVVAGCGGFSNDGPARFGFSGVSPTGSGAKTLVLDGSSTADNIVCNITNDANRQLSVVKRGSGRWVLGGDQDFGGELSVEGGELVVKSMPANQPFSWFRIVFKQNWAELPYSDLCNYKAPYAFVLKALQFYDADGNACFSPDTTDSPDFASLSENQIAYHDSWRRNLDYNIGDGTYWSPSNLARGDEHWVGGHGRNTKPYVEDPSTWTTLDIRIPEGCNVSAVDFMPYYGFDDTFSKTWEEQEKAGKHRWNFAANPKVFSMYGSTDGIVWEPLFDSDVLTVSNKWVYNEWYYGDGYQAGAAKGLKFDHAVSSRPASRTLTNIAGISVSNGGKLFIDGSAPVVSKFTVDAANGGTVSNVAFSAEGALTITGFAGGRSGVVPVSLKGSSGLENIASWQVSVVGQKGEWSARATEEGIAFSKKGLAVIIK